MERLEDVDNSRTYIPGAALQQDADLLAITKAIKNLEDKGIDTFGLYGLRQIRYAAYVGKYPDGYPLNVQRDGPPTTFAEMEAEQEALEADQDSAMIEVVYEVPVRAMGSSAVSHEVASLVP